MGKATLARMSALEAEKTRQVEEKNRALEAARSREPNNAARFEIDVKRFIQDAQSELAGVQRDAETAFLAKFKPALEEVVKAKGLRMVINEDSGLLAWADPTLDITSEVVKTLDLAAK
jgi:Skp family chaperone for outer membrane proteins